jgi:hypothetical protein
MESKRSTYRNRIYGLGMMLPNVERLYSRISGVWKFLYLGKCFRQPFQDFLSSLFDFPADFVKNQNKKNKLAFFNI